jgi:hypothetical protein
MQLAFRPTLGQRLYYMGDCEDEYAPMLKLYFCNEFAENLTSAQKERIARKVLSFAIELINEEGKDHEDSQN